MAEEPTHTGKPSHIMPFQAIATTRRSARNAALAAIAVLALGVQNAAAQLARPTLQDLPQDEGARLAITHMVDQGIMVPRSVGKFAPQSPTSLGEYLASVQHMFNLPPPKHPAVFTDVAESSPYYSAVQATSPYLARQIICFECSLSTNLYPEQPVSRAQTIITMVSVLVSQGRLKLLDEGKVSGLLANVSGADGLSPPSRVYFATAISAGIVKLTAGRAIEVAHPETRSDVAVMLDRVQTDFRLPRVRPAKPPTSLGAPNIQ